MKHGGKLAVKGGKFLQQQGSKLAQQGGKLVEKGGNLLGKVADVLDSSRTQLAGVGAGLGKFSFSTGISAGKKTTGKTASEQVTKAVSAQPTQTSTKLKKTSQMNSSISEKTNSTSIPQKPKKHIANEKNTLEIIKGPYSHLEDPKNVGPGKNFTAMQKRKIIEENMKRNGGVVRSDLSGEILTKPQKSKKGITPDPNEWQIDHIYPRDKGGTNSFSNAQVLSRKENREKSNKIPEGLNNPKKERSN